MSTWELFERLILKGLTKFKRLEKVIRIYIIIQVSFLILSLIKCIIELSMKSFSYAIIYSGIFFIGYSIVLGIIEVLKEQPFKEKVQKFIMLFKSIDLKSVTNDYPILIKEEQQ